MAVHSIDLNLDAGESVEALQNGSEEGLYQLVSTLNVACGGHAGDAETMSRVVELARNYQLNIGAHPSFPDRKGFGREVMTMSHQALVDSLVEQIKSLQAICQKQNAKLTHVKPHGALYNLAAKDREAAAAVIEAVKKVDAKMAIIGLAGSPFLDWCKEQRIKTIAEAFADRRYEANGSLRSRDFADAIISEPEIAGQQAMQIVGKQSVTAVNGQVITLHAGTICLHSDSPNALFIAHRVRSSLESAGMRIRGTM